MLDRVLSRTPWLPAEANKVRSPQDRQKILYKIHLGTREDEGTAIGRPVDVVEGRAAVQTFPAQLRRATFRQHATPHMEGPGRQRNGHGHIKVLSSSRALAAQERHENADQCTRSQGDVGYG